MDRAAPLGTLVRLGRAGLVGALVVLASMPLAAEERYAVIVAGASGGAAYAEQFAAWTDAMRGVLVSRMQFEPSRVIVLGDRADEASAATAANVRRVFRGLVPQLSARDLLFVALIGHGTFDGTDAKFNLVGPDLEAAEWGALIAPIKGRLVFVNGAPASFPFLGRLAAPNRIIISSTDSAAQRFDTVFPEYFVGAFRDGVADIDKNGRMSIWEAFAWAAARVRRHYLQLGQLATERPLLDDDGDGVGREAGEDGSDGRLAMRTYLDVPTPDALPTDDVLVDLLHRRAALADEAEELQLKRAFMPPGDYAREFERVMLALARVTREIRTRRGT